MLIIVGLPVFGWGRPTRFQSRNMRRPYFHTLLVNAAGPAMNLLLALLATVAIGFALPALGGDARKAALLALFNRFDSGSTAFPILYTLVHLATLNAFLAVFNLLPVPPLDGGYIALQLLPADWAEKLAALRPYGLMIGIALAILLVLPFFGLLTVVISYL
jgi:Zn-dependent protease